MNDNFFVSLASIKEFVKHSSNAKFKSKNKKEAYEWIDKTLTKFRYFNETKKNKGVIKGYIVQMTGYSGTMVDKLIARKKKYGKVFLKERTQNKFPRIYTVEDIALLAELCNIYQGQNAKAIKKVLEDMYFKYGDERYERLSGISVSHIYNLKKTDVFKSRTLILSKTQASAVKIGERRKPDPEGRPGFLRVDSVHQGDLNKQKGVYHINLVDEVTQYEIVLCVPKISEFYLSQDLEIAIESFPFEILNFHSDNGSEYINKTVAKLLNKLNISQTKSRARKSNDNALVESKNGAVVRKFMGHAHIPQKYADLINEFYFEHLNEFLNFHRFCAFAEESLNEKGNIVKKYPLDKYMTPVQKLLSLDNVEEYLRSGVSVESLKAKMQKISHLEAAKRMQKAKKKLFEKIISGSDAM